MGKLLLFAALQVVTVASVSTWSVLPSCKRTSSRSHAPVLLSCCQGLPSMLVLALRAKIIMAQWLPALLRLSSLINTAATVLSGWLVGWFPNWGLRSNKRSWAVFQEVPCKVSWVILRFVWRFISITFCNVTLQMWSLVSEAYSSKGEIYANYINVIGYTLFAV